MRNSEFGIRNAGILVGWLWLLGAAGRGMAQSADTLLPLPAVTILETPPARTGYLVWRADTLPLTGMFSLAERLLWEMPLDVRVNAPGALATLSARGAGPSRTAVFWQGLNLQSPMNGVVDAALIPVWPGDVVEVQYGGQSAAKSNGAMAGAVQITPPALPDSAGMRAGAGAGAGSFSRRELQASLGWGGKRLSASLRGAFFQAQNDFPFRNTALIGAPGVRQENNFVEKSDLQQFGRLRINRKNTLETAFWRQRAFREIPPAMTEAPGASWQRDCATRAVATWITAGNTSRLQHRLAYLHEFIAFHLPSDTDTSRSSTFQFSTEYTTAPAKRLLLHAAANSWLQRAQADGYADSSRWLEQWRLAAWLLAEYHWPRLRLNAQVRQEWAEGQGAPLTGALGVHWAPVSAFSLRLHVSRNFNLPTFNDRYWRGLGNPSLRPESGYSANLTASCQLGNWQLETSAFQLLLDDWILWLPGSDGLFRPGNLRRVWSRGVEANAAWGAKRFGGNWRIKSRYRFAKATNRAVYDANTGALNKVLPYTPQHSAAISLLWDRGNWSAAYVHQLTGMRFTNADNSERIPAFQTGSAMLRYAFHWTGQQLALSARLENCWNTAYQILAFRPMPGRAWQLGLLWSLR